MNKMTIITFATRATMQLISYLSRIRTKNNFICYTMQNASMAEQIWNASMANKIKIGRICKITRARSPAFLGKIH